MRNPIGSGENRVGGKELRTVHIDLGVADLEARIADLFRRNEKQLVDISTLAEHSRLAELSSMRLLIVAESAACGQPALFFLRQIRETNSELEVFLVGTAKQRLHARVPWFVRHGVDWVFNLDVDAERSAFGEMTRRRLGAPPPVAALKVISQRTRGRRIAAVALWCVRNGFLDSSCEDIADRFGHDRKTLYRWARSELGCSVADLLRLGRQEHAHELLSAGLSFTQAAARLNYASASGIARLIGKRRTEHSGPTA